MFKEAIRYYWFSPEMTTAEYYRPDDHLSSHSTNPSRSSKDEC